MRRLVVSAFLAALLLIAWPASAAPRWLTVPPTPRLPAALASGYAPVNGVRLWYAVFGKGEPVLLLHGGLANSNYWALQVRALAPHYRVIVMDSRGHGRSTSSTAPYGYDLMASDVIGLIDYLQIRKVAVVGWSDGAIVGLDLAMNHPDRVSKLFAFAANYDPAGVLDVSKSPAFTAFIARAGAEYAQLSPTPKGYDRFVAAITRMWATQPHWTGADFARISAPTWIVDADHEEAIAQDQPLTMAKWTPVAGLLIEPEVSHFAFLQDPAQFNADLLRFLATH
jgi:pimeloyl-ACP methyl ester carboxylesterase